MIALLFFVLGVALLATLASTVSLSGSADATLRQIARQMDQQTARDLAETGVRITYSWLTEQTTVNDQTQPFAPSTVGTSFYGASVVNGYNVIDLDQTPSSGENAQRMGKAGRIRVRIYPGTDATTGQLLLAIQAIGECGDTSFTTRLVVRPKNFVEYGLFYDEPLDGFVWMSGMHVFSGPVHLNMRLPGTDTVDPNALHTIVWDTSSLLFTYPDTDYFTCAGAPTQIAWYHGLVSLQAPGVSDWPYLAAAGTAPKFNMPLIPFPTSTASLKDRALAGAAAPVAPAVLVPSSAGYTSGGVYVAGSVTSLLLGTSGTNQVNQTLTFTQASGADALRTVVTLDRLLNKTTVERYRTTSGVESLVGSESLTGITNGLVYVDGDIGDTATKRGGLSGLVANSVSADAPSFLTIATPEDKTMQMDGGIVYQRLAIGSVKAPKSNATAADPLCGVLGLIMGRQLIVDYDKDGSFVKDVTIHAALLALDASGGIPSVACTNYQTRPNGKYRHLGAMIIKKDGPFGYFYYDPVTGALLDQYGFSRERLYDQRFKELAPPFFPAALRSYKTLSFQSDVPTLP